MRKSFLKNAQKGFTLIELVVVIVILGILAATALPRFVNMSSSARTAAVNGLQGGMTSAISLAHAQWLVSGGTANTPTSVTMDGVAVAMAFGYPDGSTSGITVAMNGLSGWTASAQTAAGATFTPSGGGASCNIVYVAATSAAVGPSVTPHLIC